MPDIAAIIQKIVCDIVVIPAANSGGGTASNNLGLIWISPVSRWTAVDYAEALVHETVHLSLFLDDLTHGLYLDARRVREEGALVVSAIRRERRPIDKALHSACVALALAEFYSQLRLPETVLKLIQPLRVCIAELNGPASYYLSTRGKSLVQELAQEVQGQALQSVRPLAA